MKTNLPPELSPHQQTVTDIFAAFDEVCVAVLYGSHARGQTGLEKQS
jgi:predicted nucleotidyltransferase